MTAQWYALHSKPFKEAFVWQQLRMHEIEAYYPYLRVHPVNPRSRKVRPYFPGYVFCRVKLGQVGLSTLQWLPGSVGIVSFGGMPAPVPDSLMAAIRKRVDEVNTVGGELLDGLRPGDAVTIQAGPFCGYEAIFDSRISGEERVRVLLRLLNHRQLILELPGGQIQRENR
jgi:transcriptional antiterminator RfaH